MAERWHDRTAGEIDRDIQEHCATVEPTETVAAHILGINLQHDRNKGAVILGVEQPLRVGLVKTLLSSDGSRQPGDENLTGLGVALCTLPQELRNDVAAALWGAARERLDAYYAADELAFYIPADEFRERALDRAEHYARLWREACHA